MVEDGKQCVLKLSKMAHVSGLVDDASEGSDEDEELMLKMYKLAAKQHGVKLNMR